jgi:SAM-dependent methyltransferase
MGRSRSQSEEELQRIRRYFSTAAGSWSRWQAGRSFLVDERQELFMRAVRTAVGRNMPSISVCDVGCGRGGDLLFWRDAGVPTNALAGTEAVAENVQEARAAVEGADVRLVDSFELPFEDGQFLVTTASLVLSTILDPSLRRLLFQEMVRVTAAGGVVLVYDFKVRKPTNRNVVALGRRRAALLGEAPDATWRAAPFLPALSFVLRMPRWLQPIAIALLPRTHVLYVWRRGPAAARPTDAA